MSNKINKRAKARAQKKAAKAARYAARKALGEGKFESNSKYAMRQRRRLNGAPMASRTHETPPWWTMEPHYNWLPPMMATA